MAGRPKKYKPGALRKAVDAYFDGISYERVARSADGEELHNVNGEVIRVLEYAEPPTLGGLCRKLKIDRSTWAEYANAEKNPELAPICADAKARVELYLQRELITREKGSLRGLEFDLAVNHGWTEKKAVELGGVDSVDVHISVVDEATSEDKGASTLSDNPSVSYR